MKLSFCIYFVLKVFRWMKGMKGKPQIFSWQRSGFNAYFLCVFLQKCYTNTLRHFHGPFIVVDKNLHSIRIIQKMQQKKTLFRVLVSSSSSSIQDVCVPLSFHDYLHIFIEKRTLRYSLFLCVLLFRNWLQIRLYNKMLAQLDGCQNRRSRHRRYKVILKIDFRSFLFLWMEVRLVSKLSQNWKMKYFWKFLVLFEENKAKKTQFRSNYTWKVTKDIKRETNMSKFNVNFWEIHPLMFPIIN